MVLMRKFRDSRQSHGLRIFVEPKQCQIGNQQSFCETDSNSGFRFYQFDVEATDFAGNVGKARAFVVVVPNGFDNSQGPLHFINVINETPARYVIQSVDMVWDTIDSELFV